MGNTVSKLKPLAFIVLLSLQGCFLYQKDQSLSLDSTSKGKQELKATLNSVDVSNNLLTITGDGFSKVTSVKIKNANGTSDLNISSVSGSQIIASAGASFSMLLGEAFELILSSADAQASYTITFTLQNGAVTPSHLSKNHAINGDILKFNGSDWVLSQLSSSQTYKGTWSANMSGVGLDPSPQGGDYYIVSAAGNYNDGSSTIHFDIGDWIIFNNTANKWEKVVSGLASKLSKAADTMEGDLTLNTLAKFKGGSKYVSVKAISSLANDYTLTLPATAGTSGQLLSTDGSGGLVWTSSDATGAAGGDLSGNYPNPTISGLDASKIANGSVSNAQFQYLSGVTSNIQTQLDAKAATGNYVTALTGDVTASGAGSIAATVANVGGVTAANVAAGANLANAATNANSASTIVKRDASGNFTAGTITATLNGSATNVSGTVAVANGGTGATSFTLNNLLFGNGTSAIGALATTSTPSVLLSQVTTGAPTWTTSTAGNVLKGSVTGVGFGPLTSSDLPSGTISGSGTTNYIPYYASASGLANSPVAVSGNNVGIGTTGPNTLLEVAQSNWAEAIRVSRGAVNFNIFAPGGNYGSIDFGFAGNRYFEFQNNGGMLIGAANMGGNIQAPANGLAVQGNVGIGNTSPSYPLQVEAELGVSSGEHPLMVVRKSAGGTGFAMGYQSNGTAVNYGFIRATSNFDFGIGTSANNKLLYFSDSLGNIGVGTTTPKTSLDIVGTSKSGLVGPTAATTFSSASTTSDTSISVVSTTSYPSSGYLYLYNGTVSEIVSYTGKTSTTFTGLTRALYGTTAVAWAIGNAVDLVVDLVAGPNETTAPRIITTQTKGTGYGIVPEGWVGNASVRYGGGIAVQNGVQVSNVFSGVHFGTSSAWVKGTGGSSNTVDVVALGTNSLERMRVNGDGYVGIGTTNPQRPLHIVHGSASAMRLDRGDSSVPFVLLTAFPDTTYTTPNQSWAFGGVGSPDFVISDLGTAVTGVGTQRVTVRATTGLVGIANSNPSYRLDVGGDINTSTCFRIGATTVSGTCTSDVRLKENIQDFTAGLDDLLNIKLHTYTFNGLGEMPKNGDVAVGVIAQELEKTNPELVKTRMVKMHPEDKVQTKIKTVDYSRFSYMLINAVKELYHKWFDDHEDVKKLKAFANRLQLENADKERRLQKLEKEHALLKSYLCKKDSDLPICH